MHWFLFLQVASLFADAKVENRQTSPGERRHHLRHPSLALDENAAPNITSIGTGLFREEKVEDTTAYVAQYDEYEHPHIDGAKVPLGKDAPILRSPPPTRQHASSSINGRRMNGNTQRSVNIYNACNNVVYFGIVYHTSSGKKDELWYILHSGQTTTFTGLTIGTYHVFGFSGSKFYDGQSPECLDAGCQYRYIQADFPNWNAETITSKFTFLCNQRINIDFEVPPTPAPNAAPNSRLDSTQQSWLDEHNTRRKAIHGSANYVKLNWVTSLQKSAQGYADFLISRPGCAIDHGLDGQSGFGENLAMNWNQAMVGRNPSEILRAWVDDEKDLPLDYKGHYIQANWRATKYVGCGQASKFYKWDNKYDGECFIQVCRYITPGNCNLYQNGGQDWERLMLADSSPCSPQCPQEGCFAG